VQEAVGAIDVVGVAGERGNKTVQALAELGHHPGGLAARSRVEQGFVQIEQGRGACADGSIDRPAVLGAVDQLRRRCAVARSQHVQPQAGPVLRHIQEGIAGG